MQMATLTLLIPFNSLDCDHLTLQCTGCARNCMLLKENIQLDFVRLYVFLLLAFPLVSKQEVEIPQSKLCLC